MSDKLLAQVSRAPILGRTLLIMTILLAGTAYYLFRSGLPGSPKVGDDLRAGTAIVERSRVGVLLPHESDASTTVYYSMEPASGHEAAIYIALTTQSANLYAGLMLGGDAIGNVTSLKQYRRELRIVRTVRAHLSIGAPAIISIYDQQLIFFRVISKHMSRLPGGRYRTVVGFKVHMREPAMAQQNARIAVATPDLIRASKCTLLDNVAYDAQLRNAKIQSMEDARCSEDSSRSSSTQAMGLILPTLDSRVDYSYPQPTDLGRLWWITHDDISVHASIALISEEARGQQLLFFAGIAAGLATGMAPLALEIILRAGARRRADEQ